jgi:hypothetical protein
MRAIILATLAALVAATPAMAERRLPTQVVSLPPASQALPASPATPIETIVVEAPRLIETIVVEAKRPIEEIVVTAPRLTAGSGSTVLPVSATYTE